MLTDHDYNVAVAQMAEDTTGPETTDKEYGKIADEHTPNAEPKPQETEEEEQKRLHLFI